MQPTVYYEMRFLENFIEFGALHRARSSWTLLQQFERVPETQESVRGSIALEIADAFLNMHEDLALWIQAIEGWNSTPNTHILRALDGARFRPSSGEKALTKKHVEHLKSLAKLQFASPLDFALRFGLPYRDDDDWSWVRSDKRIWMKEEIDYLARVAMIFFRQATYFSEDVGDLALWMAWNKVKHGMRVMLTRHYGWGGLITIRRDQGDADKLFHFRVADPELRRLVVHTFVGGMFLGRILNLLCQKRFRQAPKVSWLEVSLSIDPGKVSRSSMAAVLEATDVPRTELTIDPKAVSSVIHFFPLEFELGDDW